MILYPSYLSSRTQRSLIALLYGFAYTAIGIGCTGPFLASVVVGVASGGFTAGLLAFLVFALVMAGLMVAVSVFVWQAPVGRERSRKERPK